MAKPKLARTPAEAQDIGIPGHRGGHDYQTRVTEIGCTPTFIGIQIAYGSITDSAGDD